MTSWLYYTSTLYPPLFPRNPTKNESFLGSFNSHEERVIMVFAPHLLNIRSWKKDLRLQLLIFHSHLCLYRLIQWLLNIRFYSLFFFLTRSWDHFKDKILKVIKSSSTYALTLFYMDGIFSFASSIFLNVNFVKRKTIN